MTWIKPSFGWLTERSGWARKAGQEMVLAVRISREDITDLTPTVRGINTLLGPSAVGMNRSRSRQIT